jgi:uncharacterized protein (DUF433 family)
LQDPKLHLQKTGPNGRRKEVSMRGALSRRTTEHFHIALDRNICGGRPIIKGTRISIVDIAEYYLMGLNPEEIQRELPHLHLAQIYDAIAYYFDHREAIDRDREKGREEKVSKDYPAGKY